MTDNLPDLTTSSVLSETTRNILAALTGMLTSEAKDFRLTAGRLLQGFVTGRFLEQLKREWEGYKEKGQIPEDYEKSAERLTCLQELFDFLDKEIPDGVRLDAIKRIFIVAGTEYKSAPDKYLPAEYIRLVKRLEPGELLLLRTIHTLYSQHRTQQNVNVQQRGFYINWVKEIGVINHLSTKPLSQSLHASA